MSVQLRLEGNNQTGRSFDEIKGSLQGFADKAGVGLNVTKELNKALTANAAKEFRDQVKAAAAELDGSAAKMRKLKDEAKALAEQEKAAAKAQQEASSGRQQSIQASVDVYHLLKDAIHAAAAAVEFLAERGDETAKSMVRQFSLAQEQLAEVGVHGRATANLFKSMGTDADGFGKAFGNALGSVSEWFAKQQDDAAKFAITMQDAIGVVDNATAVQMFKEIDASKAGFAAAEQQRKANEAVALSKKAITDVIEQQAQAEAQAALDARVNNLNDLNVERDIQIEIGKTKLAIEAAAKAENVTHGERMANITAEQQKMGDLLQAIQKRRDVEKKGIADVEKARADAAKKAIDDEKRVVDEQAKIQQQAVEAQRKAAADAMKVAEEQARQRVELAQREAEAKKQRLQRVGAAGGNDAVASALQQQDPRAVREAYSKRQVLEAENKLSKSGEWWDMSMAQRESFQKQERLKAFKTFNTGKADQGDVGKAQMDVFRSGLQSAQQGVGLGQDFLQLATQLAQGQQQVQQDQSQLAQQVQNLSRLIGNGQNQRPRAQQVGTK